MTGQACPAGARSPVPAGEVGTVDEFAVTGLPCTDTPDGVAHFPPYLHHWHTDEAGAVQFITAIERHRQNADSGGWADGPHLWKRTVTYGEWERIT